MITAAQLRAARGLLDWTRTELAKAANMSAETIKNIEHGTNKPLEATEAALRKTFERFNVEFTDNDGVRKGVRLVTTFVGRTGYIEFLEDIMGTMRGGGRTCQFNYSDSIISDYGATHLKQYNQVMGSIQNLDARCLVPEGDVVFPVKHCVYRWLKKEHSNDIPYYLYGDKVAMLASAPGQELSWVSIKSEPLAGAYLRQFDVCWEEASLAPSRGASRSIHKTRK